MCVLFGSVNINIKRVQNAHGLVRNMDLCFMQLLADFSPQKKRNGRVGSEHVEVDLTQIYSSRHDDFSVFLDGLSSGTTCPFSLFSVGIRTPIWEPLL